MILKALYDYYQRCDSLPAMGLEEKEIGFIIVISKDGKFLRIEDCRLDKKQCKKFLVSKTVKRSGTNAGMYPCLMWDNIHFIIGTPKGNNPNPEGQYIDAFKAMVKELSEKYPNNTSFNAVKKFYENYEGKDLSYVFTSDKLCNDFLGTNKKISFRIIGEKKIVAEEQNLRNEIKGETHNEDDWRICLITGKKGEIARIHSKTPLANFPFSSLVSFQENLGFDSYGKKQAYNAPISKEAEFAYTTALNTMLARDSHNKFNIGGRTYIFWASSNNESCKQAEESVFSLFGFQENTEEDPNRNIMKVREVFNAIHSGKLKTTLDDKFYILGLVAPNPARIAVVYWSEIFLKDFAGMLLKHFEDMEVVDTRPNKRPYMGLKDMIETVTLGGKHTDATPNLPDAVVKSIFQGLPYPHTLFSSAIRRIRAEQDITPYNNPCRVAILKAYLNRKNDNNKKLQIMLDKENQNPGYLCGRLFAVLDKMQEDANETSSIRERYLNSASATPSTVFATLLNLSIHHAEKLKAGSKIYYEKLKQEIVDKLDAEGFPAHLDLQDQGRFFVGYYHQYRDFFTKKDESTEEK